MINSELLKESIADAKAVRATSLANAKAALEEAFAPRFEAMFAEKLKEESEEEEEGMMKEVEAPNQVSGKGGEAKGPSTKPVTKGQPKIKKGGKGDEDFKAVQAGKGPTDVPPLGKKVNETTEEEEEEGKMNEAGLTSEDLDEIIQELEDEVAGEEEGKAEPADPSPEEVPAPDGEEDGETPQASEQPHVDGCQCDTCLANPQGNETDINADPASGGEVDINLDEPVEDAGLPQDTGMKVGGEGLPPQESPDKEPSTEEDDENINLEELLASLNEETEEEEEEESVSEGKLPPWLKKGGKKDGKKEEEEEEEMDESVENHGISTKELKGQDKSAGVKGYPISAPDASRKQITGKNHNISGKGNIGTGATGGKPVAESIQYKIALKEAYKTIEFLRGQINEVNLLNTKLIYTNKLFKEFAEVLDDSHRMKIVESFDLTKTVREAKLAYALLAESLNFGTQFSKTKGTKQVAKPVQMKGSVRQITEGFASKPVSSTKPTGVITEATDVMALRFKKLAGIKEQTKTTITDKK